MADAELMRECILASLKVQTSFRQMIQRSLKNSRIDLTFEMLQILFSLWKQEGINQQELAARTFKDKVSLCYLINNLEKKELVYRQEDSKDRRNKLVFLTEKGRELREIVYPLLTGMYVSAAQRMPAKRVQATLNYLQELDDAINGC